MKFAIIGAGNMGGALARGLAQGTRVREEDITVSNPGHVCRGVKKVTVDGQEISGNVLPAFSDGKTHKAEVILG